jgi:hypothetical protein
MPINLSLNLMYLFCDANVIIRQIGEINLEEMLGYLTLTVTKVPNRTIAQTYCLPSKLKGDL